MKISGSVVLITGASSGIGRSLAMRLAERGASTVLTARRAALLEETRRDCARHAPSLAVPCDVRDPDQVREVVRSAHARFERVDILVNNAGYSRWTRFEETPLEDFEDMMRTNFLGAVYATRAVLPEMRRRGSGHLVNVASIAGELGVAHHTHYCATKFALVGFSEGLRQELLGSGVGITLVKPGVIDTPLFSHPSFREFPESNRRHMISRDRLCRAIVRAIERDRFEITVPAYFAFGPALRHLVPGLFRRFVLDRGTARGRASGGEGKRQKAKGKNQKFST